MPLFVALLLAGVQADAPPSPAPVPPEKKQCRRMEAATGSIMPGKAVCHSKAEWAAIDQANGDASRRLHATMKNAAAAHY